MIIGNKELAQSPGPVLARVWAFLGVKDVPSAYNTTELNDAYVLYWSWARTVGVFSETPAPPPMTWRCWLQLRRTLTQV
jgi:hypothetical protein